MKITTKLSCPSRLSALPYGLLLLLFLCLPGTTIAQGGNWLLVDTTSRDIVVFNGDREISRFNNIAIGRGGVSQDRVRGDYTTPLGEFRISWINLESRFHIFLGFDFPTFDDASRAYASGRLPLDDFISVTDAVRSRRLPPQDTILGGHLGIHGVGRADEEIHRIMDWTRGCIALLDSEMEALIKLVGIGTRVVVR